VGPIGPAGVPGPTVVSADPGNIVALGTDGFLYASQATLCAAGVATGVANSSTLNLVKSGCNISGSVRVSADPGNQIIVSPSGDGVYVAPPVPMSLEQMQDLLQTTFPQFTYDDAGNVYTIASVPMTAISGFTVGCGLLGAGTAASALRVNPVQLIGSSTTSSLELGGGTCDIAVKVDGTSITRSATGALQVNWAALSCAQVRTCFSGSGVVSVNTVTGVIGLNTGSAGQILTMVGTTPSWQTPAATVSVLAGTGINVTGGPAYTVSTNTAALVGNTVLTSLEAGSTAGSLQVRVDGSTITRDATGALVANGCNIIRSVAAGAAATGDMIVAFNGTVCKSYTFVAGLVAAVPTPAVAATAPTVLVGLNGATPVAIVPSHVVSGESCGGAVSGSVSSLLGEEIHFEVAAGSDVPGSVNVSKAGAVTTVSVDLSRQRYQYRVSASGGSLVPASDGVVAVVDSVGGSSFALVAPSACDPNDFHITKTGGAGPLTVTLPVGHSFVGGGNSLVVPAGLTSFGLSPSAHILHTGGTTWVVI
jgi:hypothetical protein